MVSVGLVLLYPNFSIPFNETVKRFQTKNNIDFTEEDMKRWWNEKDILGFENEKMITKEMSVFDTVKMILGDDND